ncbi:MAG: GNAT family protein [Solirubrobacteraceae bacterium]
MTRESLAMELRPLAPDDVPELRRIHATPEVARWWGEPHPEFPSDELDVGRLVIEVDRAVAGLIQYEEEIYPRFRWAAIDLFVDPALHGRGIGTEAVRRVVRHLIDERGHHRITIDPAVANERAIGIYERIGFRPVGVMRAYELVPGGGGWRDALLMDLLAGEER